MLNNLLKRSVNLINISPRNIHGNVLRVASLCKHIQRIDKHGFMMLIVCNSRLLVLSFFVILSCGIQVRDAKVVF